MAKEERLVVEAGAPLEGMNGEAGDWVKVLLAGS